MCNKTQIFLYFIFDKNKTQNYVAFLPSVRYSEELFPHNLRKKLCPKMRKYTYIYSNNSRYFIFKIKKIDSDNATFALINKWVKNLRISNLLAD